MTATVTVTATLTDGASLVVNVALVRANARYGAAVAVASAHGG